MSRAPTTWFDSHCHLYEAADPAETLERARSAGVVQLCVLATEASSAERAIELTGEDGVYAGVAIHPTEAKGWDEAWLDPLVPLLRQDRVVAVGESGLDLYWDDSFLADQVAAFRAHIALAKERDLALVIHTRNSVDETLDVLTTDHPPERFVFHCWSGGEAQLDRALDMGAFISFAGNVSFKNAGALRAAARRTAPDRVLVETDSPYLAPVPHRGQRNEPAYLPLVGEAVAAARDAEVDEVARLTTANARRLFGL